MPLINCKMLIDKLFDTADRNLLCNTAYPYQKKLFEPYFSKADLFAEVHELSFYLHIPFCKQLCRFCEYTRFKAGDEEVESRYLDILQDQVHEFLDSHTISMIYGMDIGGGTPTALSKREFARLLWLSSKLENAAKRSLDYEKSIEISFSTIDEPKMELIAEYGFLRLSAGLQSSDRNLLSENGRVVLNEKRIEKILLSAHKHGIKKVNLDLMYGLEGQSDDSIRKTLDSIASLHPEQVTVYETRYNKYKKVPASVTRELQYRQYCILYEGLIKHGYTGRFGANTFSSCGDDGLSSYIRNRMKYCVPYKGFGISAQSMTRNGISYGSLKNTKAHQMPPLEMLTEEYNYLLPASEIAAKYVSVALYGGSFRLDILDEILGEDSVAYFQTQLLFLLQRELINIVEKEVVLTEKGFRFYGAIASLFWSEEQQQYLLDIMDKRGEHI